MMKRLTRLMCLMLALCLLPPLALAEDAQETEVISITEKLEYTPDALFVSNGMLYAQTWQGLMKKVDGGWQSYVLTNNGNILTLAMAEDAVYYVLRQYETYNPDTDSWEKPDNMHSIYRAPLDADGNIGEGEMLCGLEWDLNEDDYPQIEGTQMQGDALYLMVHADNMDWDKLTLYRIDLTSGKATVVVSDYINGLSAYKDGQLLSRWYNYSEMYDERGQLVRMPEIVSIDLSTGAITTLASLPSKSAGALVYDAASDSAYCADSTYVYRYDSSFSAAEPVGYLVGSSMSRAYSTNAVIYRDHYLATDWNDEERIVAATIDPSLLPTRTLRLSDSWYLDTAIRDFAKLHPDVAIEYVDLPGYTAESYQSHMQSPQAADVYTLNLPYNPYAALLRYGLLTDLSSSDKLVELVSGMYPNMTDKYLIDGKLYGLPVYIYASMMGYYPSTFEKVGLTEEDVPTTFDELFDFMVNWYYDYYDDYPEISLFDWSPDLRDAMFSLIFQQQVLTCAAKGENITFRTPEIQRLLNRLDSQETKTVFDALGPKKDENGNIIDVYEWSEEPTTLLSNSNSPLPQRYRQWNPPEPMALRLSEDADPAIETNVVLMVINRASQNQELAMELLEYVSENLPVDLQTTMIPEVSDPIEVEYYQDNVTWYEERIAECEKEIAKLQESGADDEDTVLTISDFEEQIGWYREYLVQMEEEERWAFTEEEVAYYKEHVAPYLVVLDSNIFSGSDNPAATAMRRYVDGDGNMNAEAFISEIDRIVSMMQAE